MSPGSSGRPMSASPATRSSVIASRSATAAPNDHPQTRVGPSASSRIRPMAASTSLISACPPA